MTKKEFVQNYAKKSGLTVRQLKELGYRAFQCDCDCPDCPGWQIVHGPMKGEPGWGKWGKRNKKLRRRIKELERHNVELEDRVATLETHPQWTWTQPHWLVDPGTSHPLQDETITWADGNAGKAT